MNVLFVCSKNRWRSRTAETIFKDSQKHAVRSAGTESDARIRVSQKLIAWSEMIFVMERRHKEKLLDRFGSMLDDKEIVVLHIEDDFQYMDEELIETIRMSVAPYITF